MTVFGIQHRIGQCIAYYDADDNSCISYNIGTIQAILLQEKEGETDVKFITRRNRYSNCKKYACFRIVKTDLFDLVPLSDIATHSPANKVDIAGNVGTIVSFPATPTTLCENPEKRRQEGEEEEG